MARPFDSSEFYAAAAFDKLPSDVQDDGLVQTLFDTLFDPGTDWATAHDYHDSLANYLASEYGYDLDDYFDWDDWRDSYDATH